MPAIRIGAQILQLPGNSQIALERNSPLLADVDERGSSSLTFTIPKTDANNRALGFPNRFDHRAGEPPQVLSAEALDDMGNGLTTGNLIYRGATAEAYQYNLEFGDSAVMARLKARKLQQFRFGGPRLMEASTPWIGYMGSRVGAIAAFMEEVTANPDAYDFVFAPFSNNDHRSQWDSYVEGVEAANKDLTPGQTPYVPTHHANFNSWTTALVTSANGVGFGYPLSITVPGQAVVDPIPDTCNYCPLPKVEYVVRTLFAELQLELETDVFDEPEMKELVFVPVAGMIEYVPFPLPDYPEALAGRFFLANHLPNMTAQELLRGLMDEFGWHFDVTSRGICRLLRAAPLVLTGNAVEIASLTGPKFSIEQSEPSSIVVQPLLASADRYAQEYGEQPDPSTILQPVATAADLPTAQAADLHRLVQAERRYYLSVAVTDSTTEPSTTTHHWEPGPFYLPPMQVGTAESTEDYELSAATVLTSRQPVQIFGAIGTIDVLTFLEPGTSTETITLTSAQTSTAAAVAITSSTVRSATLRLAFYRGLQALGFGLDTNGQPAVIPWLTQRAVGPTGAIIGELSLEAHGPNGLVQQKLLPLMALKAAKSIAKFPAYFSVQQFHQLDFSRMVSIRGDEFMVRRLSLNVPVTGPGQLELVTRSQVATTNARPQVSDGFYTTTGTPVVAPTCTILITEVQHNGDVATVITDRAQGALKFQLNTGTPQDSNVFTGLVAGQQYVFWVYDLGVVGCNQVKAVTW